MKPHDHCARKRIISQSFSGNSRIEQKDRPLLRELRSLFLGAFLILLAACGGGGSGGSGGGLSSGNGASGTATNTTGTTGTTTGTAGLTSSLFLNQSSFDESNGTISNPVSNLLDFTNMSMSSPLTTNTSTSYFYPWLVPDNAGNLWAVENQVPSSINGNTHASSVAIVKFPNASSNPSTLSPTTVITLPSNVFVQSLAFDSSENLWFDEKATNDSTGQIWEYTASSSYGTGTATATYSPSGLSSQCNNASAYLAFDGSGHLWANENYATTSNGCNNQFAEYSSTGSLLNTYGTLTGSNFSILFDASGNMWGIQNSCSGCSSNANAAIWKWNGTPASGNPTTPVVNLSAASLDPNQLQGAFDGNGNLWFVAQSSAGNCLSNGSGESYLEELSSGQTALVSPAPKAYGNCNYLAGIAVNPAPTTLPIH